LQGRRRSRPGRRPPEPPQNVHWNFWPALLTVLLGIPGSFAIFLAALFRTKNHVLSAVVLLILLFAFAGIACLLRKRAIQAAQSAALLKRFGTSDQAEIAALADTYIKLLEARDAAQADANAKSVTAEALLQLPFLQ